MSPKLSELSVAEIRERYLDSDDGISAHMLHRLKRDPRRGVRRICRQLEKRYDREKEERSRLNGMLNFERVLWRSGVERIAGVDEAGIGPLAGPVVAAAVVFPPDTAINGIDDSKQLDADRRAELAVSIRSRAAGVGIGLVEVEEIDRINIYQAGILALRRAVEALPLSPQHVLVDARRIPDLEVPQNSFNKGDGINFSIAAASIIAKTHRDALMEHLDRRYPAYGLARHKGYSTPQHQRAIREHGPSPIHRRSFAFIRELCGEFSALFYELQRVLDAAEDDDGLRAFEARLDAHRAELADAELHKLRLILNRRWKRL